MNGPCNGCGYPFPTRDGACLDFNPIEAELVSRFRESIDRQYAAIEVLFSDRVKKLQHVRLIYDYSRDV